MGWFDFACGEGLDSPGMHLAHSDDGLHWTRVDGAPFVPVSYGFRGAEVPLTDERREGQRQWHTPLTLSDATDFYYDPVRGCYGRHGKEKMNCAWGWNGRAPGDCLRGR